MSRSASRAAIGVMCRVPHGGGGKSRLRERHEASFVDELQAAMLADTLASADRVSPADRVVFVAPLAGGDAVDALDTVVRSAVDGWEVVVQEGDDLGDRILHVFRTLFDRGADRVLVTGSDAPMLAPSSEHLDALAEDEVLLYPCEDGGYAAIGLRRIEPRLFVGMSWSTDAVAHETRRRATACGLRVRDLPTTFDVDEPADVERLCIELARDPTRAPRTAALLARVPASDAVGS